MENVVHSSNQDIPSSPSKHPPLTPDKPLLVSQTSWQGPETLTLIPTEHDGFGFSLRYFLVHPTGSSSPTKGFHRDSYWFDQGLPDNNEDDYYPSERQTQPVDIFYAKNIKEGGAAHKAGLRSGDRVVSVNGQLIGGKSYNEVIDNIEYCSGELKLGVLPHDEDILQSVYEEYIYDDKPLIRKDRSQSSSSLKMYQQASINKWSVPITNKKASYDSGGSSNDIINNNNDDKKYEPCVQFFAGTPIVTVEGSKSSRSNSISSSGSATPLNRNSSGKASPSQRTSGQKFDPCVSFISGKPVKNENPKEEDEDDESLRSVHAQKIQLALRKEANKKGHSIGKRLAPKMMQGVTKPGAVSNMAGLFASGNVTDESSRRSSVTSCLRDDFKSRPRVGTRNAYDTEKENKDSSTEGLDKNDTKRSLRKPLSSLSSQATLVQDNKLVLEKNTYNTIVIGKNGMLLSSATSSSTTAPTMRKRNMIANGRKVSISSSVENSDDEESHVDSGDENELNNWQGRRSSYLLATDMKKGARNIMNGEADDEDSDNYMSPKKMSPQKNMEDYETKPIIKEGPLNRKLEKSLDRKKPSQRQWKPIYAVLKGHRLFCYKDGGNEADEEIIQPIPLRSSIIEIASDYTKRRHVFRLMTSHGNEYIFQAEDTSSMMSWVHTLREHNPDKESLLKSTATLKQENHLSHSPPTKSASFKDKKSGLSIRKPGFGLRSSGRKSRNKEKDMSVAIGKTFGNTLQNCPPAKFNKNIPLLVEHCCTVIEERGKEVVGIYRVPGNAATYQALQIELDTKEPEDIDWADEKWHELNNIGSLLKLFLRKLEEPVIPTSMYSKFIQSNRLPIPTERLKTMKQLIKSLPDYHNETLQFLIRHLKVIADHSDENKMEPTNLAIVFGPTVVRTKEQSMISMVEDMSDQCKIIETLLKQCDWIFGAPDDTEPVVIEKEVDVINQNTSIGLMQCLNNQIPATTIVNSDMNNNGNNNGGQTNKKSNKFSTLRSNFSMKLRSGSTKNISPKIRKKLITNPPEDESDIETSGCSSQSPPMNEQRNIKRNHEYNTENGVNTIKIKADPVTIDNNRTPDLSPELTHRSNGSPKISDFSEKTLSRLTKLTSTLKIDDAKVFGKDEGHDSGVTSPQRLDSDDNMSVTSDSASSSRKESLDSLSGPSPRINRRVSLPRQQSVGSAGSSNEERSPTLPKSPTNSIYPSVIEGKETSQFMRQELIRSSVRGTADTRGPNSHPDDKRLNNVIKRSDTMRRRTNLPVSPRSSKRELCTIMPGDGNDYDEKLKALMDPSYNRELQEKAVTEMNQQILTTTPNVNIPRDITTNADWWLSGCPAKKTPTPPKDKAQALNIIANVIKTQKRISPEFREITKISPVSSEEVLNKHEFLSPNTRRKAAPKSPSDTSQMELSARFDHFKQKEVDYQRRIDNILGSSTNYKSTNYLSESTNDIDKYLKQMSQLLENCEMAEDIHSEGERKKMDRLQQSYNTSSKLNGDSHTRRLKSESDRDKNDSASSDTNHKVLARSVSANPAPRKDSKNRTSPLLDTTYSHYNYSKLYPR